MQSINDILHDGIMANAPTVETRTPRQIERRTLSELDLSHPLLKGVVDMVYSWRDRMRSGDTGASMVIVGPYGTGKTHIARAVLWSICLTTDDGKPIAPAGRFYGAADLLHKMNPYKTDWGGTESPRPVDFIGAVPIVVIDDVGTESELPYIAKERQEHERQQRYYRVIDYCYTFQIAMVITSNLSINQLKAHVGGRCWDRLQSMATAGFMFDLSGVPSWRVKQSGRK